MKKWSIAFVHGKDKVDDRNKESIDILGVFHGAMEIERYLKILA